jgi:predicted TPR repeat methyltransferase
MPNITLQNAQSAFQAGRLADAGRLFHEVLRGNPRDFEALYGLGLVYLHAQQFEQAQQLFGETVRLDPLFADGFCVRGVALLRLGRHQEGIVCLERALAIRPNSVDALANHATALLEIGQAEKALAELDRAIAIDPNHFVSWNNRGNALVAMNRQEDAVESYTKALEIDPTHRLAAENRDNALFQLRRLPRCPPGFMRNLFDGFSSHYDDTMLVKLNYRAHLHLRDLADRVLPKPASPQRILDLGCGTGLVGEAFRDFAAGGQIDGIDLAPKMIEAARARGIYRDLTLGDLEIALANPGPQYQLVLAADTMIYLGDLSRCFSGVFRRLEPGGHYLFAVESLDGEGWEQTPENRFRHSESYLRSEAARAGLDVIAVDPCTLRNEHNVPVGGLVVALRKPLAN